MTPLHFGAALPRVRLLAVMCTSPRILKLSSWQYPFFENMQCSHEPLSWITAPVHQYDALHADFLLLSFFRGIPSSSLIAFSFRPLL